MTVNNVAEAVDQYCSRLCKALHRVPAPERDEIVLEVRSHILERVEAEPNLTENILAEIFRAVGEPKELASEYRTQAMLRRATGSTSPWLLLRATLRWAASSLAGVVAFVATAVGYACAFVFLACALLKPVFPSRIGLWLAPEQTLSFGYWNGRVSGTEIYGISVRPPVSFVLGTLSPTNGPVRELLGKRLIPVGVLCGVLFFVATTIVAQWFIKRFGRKKNWNVSPSQAGSLAQSGSA